jgi:ribose transport system substrate-binding protein
MQIAIASKVDGIIIEPNGDNRITSLINKAEREGIPVITVFKDAPLSNRISFVGVSSYDQGQVYGKQVAEVVKEGKRKVTVLLNSDNKDTSQDIVYSSIRETVADSDAEVKAATVNSQNTFSLEEDIRNIIMDTENPPDVLVCLNSVDTLCAYQAIVDYNKVGDIDIIGYYNSDLILNAIEKKIIHSTMVIDAKQMGSYCAAALTEYRKTKRVSNNFSVDISVITSENVQKYINDRNSETKELE